MPPPLRLRPFPLRPIFHHSQNHPRIPPPYLRPIRSRHSSSASPPSHISHEVARFSWTPRIFRKSTWDLIIPKFLRRPRSATSSRTAKKKNPATYFIWIYILIGSQAIRIIGVQSEYRTYTRKAETRIAKLREVLRALQAGEEVDVEKELGVGREEEEVEWEEAMREIVEEEDRWVKARREAKEREEKRQLEERGREEEEQRRRLDASPIAVAAAGSGGSKIVSGAGFY